MEWLKKLSAAIDYIEGNLDGDLSYDEAARIACCSIFYFQRVFSYVTGVSLSEYIRRRRMTQAAFDLQRTGAKVIDVALKYGYSSPTSFYRAFQSVHNISPAAAKSMGSTLYYIAAATDKPAPQGMFECEIPKASWAVFENDGQFKENVQCIFRRFYTEWLPFSGYAHAGLPDIEVYTACPEAPTSGHSEVWIAIQKNREDKVCTI